MDENTTLADLLSLNLHNFEDEVRNIVDKAVKEMSMEKVLKELDKTWSEMEFEHDKHPRTGITQLKTSEELIETLEDNQVRFYCSLYSWLIISVEVICIIGISSEELNHVFCRSFGKLTKPIAFLSRRFNSKIC